MKKATSHKGQRSSTPPARVLRAVRAAAVAMTLFDHQAARALLDLRDEALGRLFKVRLLQIAGLSTALNLDVRTVRGQRRTNAQDTQGEFAASSVASRDALVSEGKLLHASDFCAARGITEKRLEKDVTAGRVFSVDIDGERYYPAFFLVPELSRRPLAKLVRRLITVSGWDKWHFLTTPQASLGQLTPLQALLSTELDQVLKAADALGNGAVKTVS